MAAGFIIASFALAFAQRPGWATSDTKIDLHVDPGAFLGQVASVWTHSIDLGAVHGAQYGGYLWPMGPIFALLHGIGLSAWVSQRIWLGLIFAISAWGMLRLLDAFVGRPRGVAHLVAAAFYVLNPYTVIFTGRTSIALLGYAALPWLLLIVYRGVREPRGLAGWWWAAAFALILTSIGGGINGAVVGWMLVGPLVLLIYEPLIGTVRWRDSGGFLVRIGVLGLLASLWWIVPLALSASYGIDFLQFTEQPRSIWGTNSAPEALRLMAYWTSYIGVGFFGVNRPLFSEAGTLLFNPLAVGASLLLPALALGGFIWTRRWRYAPLLLLVLLVGVAIELAAFPPGTPSRETMEWVYRHVPLVRFMRTTQKAAPLVAIGTAGLLGLGAQLAWARLLALPRPRVRRVALVAAPVGLATLIALAALPLVRGTAIEKQLTWKRIPSAWTDVGRDLDRGGPHNSRALVLPGQIFANYTWGGTTDAILPRVTDRPVAVRYETPYGDPHGTDLLWTVDRLVEQGRLLPGQLLPLVRLIGAGAIVTGSDDDPSRSGAVNAAAAAAELDRQGLDRPTRSYGPTKAVEPPSGELGPARRLPEVRRYDVSGVRGIVHVDSSGPATVVDGGAEGLAGLAAFGALPGSRPILYAGDLSPAQLRAQAADGAELVVSDSNRRRRFVPEFGRQNLGATLPEKEPLDPNQAIIEPFPDRGTDAQTVAVLKGATYVRAPNAGGLLEFPERDAIKAFDGDPSTVWTADRYYHPRSRWIEIGFEHRRDVPYVELLPLRDESGQVTEVDINGKRAKVHLGWNRIPVDLKDVASVRITLVGVRQPQDTDLRGNGGMREIRIPGVRVRQSLRPPVLSAQALGGRDLSHLGLTYLFERTTADDPFRRDRQTGSPALELAKNRVDPEDEIDRVVFAPAARAYELSAWVHPAVDASDSSLDRLAGLRGPRRVRLVGPLPRSAALPRLERLRRRSADRLARHLGAPGCALPVDLLDGPAYGERVAAAARAARPADQAAHEGPAELAGRQHAAAGRERVRRGRPAAAGAGARLSPDRARHRLPARRQRAPARHAGGRHRLAQRAGPGAGERPQDRSAAHGLRKRARGRRRAARAAAAERHRGAARLRPAAVRDRLRRGGADGGGHPVRPLTAGPVQRRPAAAALAGSRPAARRQGRRCGRRPRQDRQQLGQGRAREAERPVVARARPELLEGLAGRVRRP